jgi:hypothetical protein
VLKLREVTAIAAAALTITVAGAADHVVERAAAGPAAAAPRGCDGTLELQWDSGKPSWLITWRSGAGVWVGNDFDISTVKTYPYLRKVRLYSTPTWPNGSWDGFYLAVYSFAGGVPGSMMWPAGGRGKYVRGTTTGYGWQNFDVGWALPSGVRRFAAAVEQFYDYPNCDPHLVDDNPTFRKHSWAYYQGNWHPLSNKTGYYNLMLRVIVDDDHNPGVAPATVGRVKALYY